MRRFLLAAALSCVWATPAHALTKTYSSGNLHAAIPDGSGELDKTIIVADSGRISNVSVAVRLDHPRDSDLTLTLVSPKGTEVVLSRKQGGGGANFGSGPRSCRGEATGFEDGGIFLGDDDPPFRDVYGPEERLAVLRGEEARGRWTLRITDDTPSKAGTLFCWGLGIGRDIPIHRRAAGDRVRAVLSYKHDEPTPYYSEARLRVVRRGVVRLDAPVKRIDRGSQPVRLAVRDLDADGEPEVILDLWTQGAHCCTQTLIYRYDRRGYRPAFHDWGNAYPAYRIVDLDGDGRPELHSRDDRFAYAFTSFAGSVFPLRIWRFDRGRLFDVTRHFRAAVAADGRANWLIYLDYRKERTDVRGALAAWLADEYLLGRQNKGWERLEELRRKGALGSRAGAYLKALRSFLRKLGYASVHPSR